MTTTTSLDFITANERDDESFDPRDCVGNSHALIEHYYSSISARCACGSTIVLRTDGRWVHPGVAGRGIACPPYDCACGQRHNVRAS